MTATYMRIGQLPPAIAGFLKSQVSYNRPEIAVERSAVTSITCSGGDGYRGFAILANLETGECRLTWGSWGGANMFNPTNQVDLDPKAYPLPLNGAVITGVIGGGKPTYARMVVHPDNLALALPSGNEAPLSEPEILCLNIMCGLKPGYRKEAMARVKVPESTIDTLVSKGLAKRNAAGAVSVTTEGRNKREANRRSVY